MKRIICAVVAAGLLAAGPLSGRARAEEDEKDGGHKGRAEHMLKDRLGLTDDQAAKVKAAHEALQAAMKPLREKAKESRRKLEEQVRGLASDKDIQATLDALDANRKAMQAEREKAESSMASALKPYQRAKMRLMMAHRMKARRHGRGGPEGGWKGRRGGDEDRESGHDRGHGDRERGHDDD
jgi:Spy/CpxP family protein refolding chaperone